jgi:5-methylcytosine-specific restriction endonuclease McrA
MSLQQAEPATLSHNENYFQSDEQDGQAPAWQLPENFLRRFRANCFLLPLKCCKLLKDIINIYFHVQYEMHRVRDMNMEQQRILRTDISGMPLEWVSCRDVVKFYHLQQVAYVCGSSLLRVHGGTNAVTGLHSVVEVNSIVATHGHCRTPGFDDPDYIPPLNNQALFKRDAGLCMYCGGSFRRADLSRDHVTPTSQGGRDIWNNVVTACRRCNNYKAGRTPEQAGMQLLAIPFVPTRAEYIFLKARHVLADQMEFLRAHFPRKSPLRSDEYRKLVAS